MQRTNIEWADSTWNPVTGCHNNCPYCYARSIANRFKSLVETIAKKCSISALALTPGKNDATYEGEYHCPFPFGFDPTFYRERLTEPQHKRKPQRIFVCSMADMFGPWVPNKWIKDIFNACKAAPQHKYMFLTKFPERYELLYRKELLPELPNFYYGTTINKELQLDTAFWTYNSKVRTFLSIEPITDPFPMIGYELPTLFTHDMVIVGAETGNRRDKVIPKREWIDPIVRECAATCVPLFMKDSLIPIMGEENMIRELPEGLKL